jgi:hypothetical protein
MRREKHNEVRDLVRRALDASVGEDEIESHGGTASLAEGAAHLLIAFDFGESNDGLAPRPSDAISCRFELVPSAP